MPPFESILWRLNQFLGLDASTLGFRSIRQAVDRRKRVLGVETDFDYAGLLTWPDGEVLELVEEVVVLESWFFRHPYAFDCLVSLVKQIVATQAPGERVRILSLPCCRGEEPYSIAMALLDAGVDSEFFLVEARDVSRRALEMAALGHYPSSAFREERSVLARRYFEPMDDGELYRIGSEVRNCVRFEHENIVEADAILQMSRYHIIFCRNLMIYLDRKHHDQVVDRLTKMLLPEGTIFLGAGESRSFMEQGFVRTGVKGSFAIQRSGACRLDMEGSAMREGVDYTEREI